MMRTVVFGVDGLTFAILHPLIERGELPNFRRLQQEGCEAILESKYPPLTPPAWISLFTGLKPAGHGVYDFWAFEEPRERPQDTPRAHVQTRRKGGKAIWNILSEYGKKVLIMNVPMTYPPEPVNGTMVSGYLTPDQHGDFTYPQHFKKELYRTVPGYTIDLDLHYIFNGKPREENRRLLDATLYMTRQRINLLRYMLKERVWDFCFAVFVGADRLQHPLWEDIMAFDTPVIEYYRLLDHGLGMVLEQLGPDDCLFVVSDHGFQGVHRCFDINEYLYSRKLLALDPDYVHRRSSAQRMSRIKHTLREMHLFSLAQKMKITFRTAGVLRDVLPDVSQPIPIGIDWANTQACVPSYSCFPSGYADIFLKPGLSAACITALREDLASQLDPASGEALISAIYTAEVFGTGPYARPEPHLLLLPGDGITFNIRLGNERFWDEARMSNDANKRCGVHHKDGVLYAYGGAIKRGLKLPNVEIYDVVPTVLHSMHIEASDVFDGRVLRELFVDAASMLPTTDVTNDGLVQRKLKKLAGENVHVDGGAR